jgi:hypothetical protein
VPFLVLSNLLANPSGLIHRSGVAAILALACAAPVAAQSRVNPDAATLKSFNDRVEAYVTLQKKLQAGLPALSPSDRTSGIEAHQKALAERIREARRTARQGDIFGDTGPLFKQVFNRDGENRSVRDAFASMQEVPPQQPPAVNASYPAKSPLATVPPLILVNLPRLPDGIEYRFMGRDLILRDRNANLIVDFLAGAVPAVRK